MFPEKERTSKPPAEVVWRMSIPAEGREQSVEIPRISEGAPVGSTGATSDQSGSVSLDRARKQCPVVLDAHADVQRLSRFQAGCFRYDGSGVASTTKREAWVRASFSSVSDSLCGPSERNGERSAQRALQGCESGRCVSSPAKGRPQPASPRPAPSGTTPVQVEPIPINDILNVPPVPWCVTLLSGGPHGLLERLSVGLRTREARDERTPTRGRGDVLRRPEGSQGPSPA